VLVYLISGTELGYVSRLLKGSWHIDGTAGVNRVIFTASVMALNRKEWKRLVVSTCLETCC
jgi:hypothetical protein